MTVGVLYEHPEWFRPLFAALQRRRIPHIHVDAASLRWHPAEPPSFDLLINRMSPSAYLRGHAHAIHAALHYLEFVEDNGIPIINGSTAYRLELSKAAQLSLMQQLGVSYPRAAVINDPARAVAAADNLRFPVVVKPNIGGSGAGIRRYDSPADLRDAIAAGRLDLGIDHTAIVQEYLPARGGSITRIELLDHELLYAIRITPPASFGFNLCPADICRDEESTGRSGTAIDGLCATKPAMQIELADVPGGILEQARAIAAAGQLDICGIEYLVDDRDGGAYIYDINALSNFVTDAPRIVGFDPFDRFVEYVERSYASSTLVTGASA
jgi:glutathione synthase/RimK-type ligase-like ATP-grasp enzyme